MKIFVSYHWTSFISDTLTIWLFYDINMCPISCAPRNMNNPGSSAKASLFTSRLIFAEAQIICTAWLNSWLTSWGKYCMKIQQGNNKNIRKGGVSEWLLLSANSAIFQLYHGENKLILNEMVMVSLCTRPTRCDIYSASSLKQQSVGRHVAPLWHSCLIPNQPVFALAACLAEKQQIPMS